MRVEKEGGATFLTGLRGLQIVNGGQMTGSLHRARRKDSIPLTKIEVPDEIIGVTSGNLDNIVASVSRAANKQKPIQKVDFSAGDPFHREVEEIANSTWLENGRGRWFYERARGSYLTTEQKAALRKSEEKIFQEQTPKSRRFDKLDLGRWQSAWDGYL